MFKIGDKVKSRYDSNWAGEVTMLCRSPYYSNLQEYNLQEYDGYIIKLDVPYSTCHSYVYLAHTDAMSCFIAPPVKSEVEILKEQVKALEDKLAKAKAAL